MLLGWILLAIGVAGFGAAAYLDLKTTEFPDWLPYGIIISALAVRGIFSWIEGDIWIIGQSVIFGGLMLGFGLLLFFLKQWGDGDAWLLGALGFLFPDPAGFANVSVFPFPAVVLFNFFFSSFFYLIVYSVALGIKSPKMTKKFFAEIKKDIRRILIYAAVITAGSIASVAYLVTYARPTPFALGYIISFPVIFLAVIVFVRYGRFVEQNLFKRKIPASKLREGDVLMSDKWRGLKKDEIEKLKKKGGNVWIKEGVRFAPVFIIALLITLFYGNILALFLV